MNTCVKYTLIFEGVIKRQCEKHFGLKKSMSFSLITLQIISFFFFTVTVFSQQTKIDSLKSVLEKTETPVKRLEVLNKICDENTTFDTSENAKKYLDELVTLSVELKNDKVLLNAYQNYSTFYVWKHDLPLSVDYIMKAKQIAKKINNVNEELKCLIQASSIYNDIGKFDLAEKTVKEAIKISKKPNFKSKYKCSAYQVYGNIMLGQDDEDKAIEKFLSALNCLEDNNVENISTETNSYQGLCWLYINRKQYDKAEEYANIAIKKLNSSKDNSVNYQKALFYRTLGRIYTNTNKIDKAIEQQKLALQYFEKSNHLAGKFEIQNNLSFSYYRKKDFKNSYNYAVKAKKVAKEMKHPLAINSAYISEAQALHNMGEFEDAEKILTKVAKDTINKKNWPSYMKEQLYEEFFLFNKNKKDYKKSLHYSIKLLNFKDSLNTARFKTQITKLETQYQTEKKEKENLQLKAEKAEQQQQLEKENKQKWLYGIGFLMSVLALGVFGYYYRENKQQKALIEDLQKELHHRIKNNLSIINRFVEVLKEEFNEPKFTSKLSELQNRIGSINEVHQQLYNNKDVTQLNMKKYINQLANNVQHSFPNNNININKKVDESLVLTSTKSFPLGIIINEFLTNSYKYAFNNTTKGDIDISMKENEQNYTLFLSDNGKGFPKEFNIKTDANFGLRIIRLLCSQINASFNLEDNNGVQLIIQVPKK